MDKENDQLNRGSVPDEIKGWSWGAFGLNGIWGVGNRTYVALLAFLPVVNVVMIVLLGLFGRKWAWKNRDWESIEQFKRVQRKWDIGGMIAFGIYVVVGLIGFIDIIR
jgi:hypothetical protein